MINVKNVLLNILICKNKLPAKRCKAFGKNALKVQGKVKRGKKKIGLIPYNSCQA